MRIFNRNSIIDWLMGSNYWYEFCHAFNLDPDCDEDSISLTQSELLNWIVEERDRSVPFLAYFADIDELECSAIDDDMVGEFISRLEAQDEEYFDAYMC